METKAEYKIANNPIVARLPDDRDRLIESIAAALTAIELATDFDRRMALSRLQTATLKLLNDDLLYMYSRLRTDDARRDSINKQRSA